MSQGYPLYSCMLICDMLILSLAIYRETGYYFYSYDSTERFDPNSPNSNNLIYHHDPLSGCPASIQNITVNRLAQEIVFINKRPPDYNSTCEGDDPRKATLEICEVKVIGKVILKLNINLTDLYKPVNNTE